MEVNQIPFMTRSRARAWIQSAAPGDKVVYSIGRPYNNARRDWRRDAERGLVRLHITRIAGREAYLAVRTGGEA